MLKQRNNFAAMAVCELGAVAAAWDAFVAPLTVVAGFVASFVDAVQLNFAG
jgi:hypothetical protein